MIVSRMVRISTAFKMGWFRVGAFSTYIAVVVILSKQGIGFALPTFIIAILGTVLSIVLGFRTNNAYDRWWEARKIWGAIVNDSRSWGRQILTLPTRDSGISVADQAVLQKELLYRQMAWNQALNNSLRERDGNLDDLTQWLEPSELAELRKQQNPCVAMLQTQAVRIREMHDGGDLDVFRWMQLDAMLTRFSDHMGMCERIKTTVFPTIYSNIVTFGDWLFVLLVPHCLAQDLGWAALPLSLLLGAVFNLIELTSTLIQDPFENRVSDTPMDTICRTIEINLRQQLGETKLPPKLEPIAGVLM